MILLLAACAVHNPFTTQQCRRLIPYQILFKELRSSNLQLKIKKAYLHYFFYVYCMSSDGIRREIPSSILEELLYRVILPDFELYTVYILHLATISKKELFKIIMTKQALDLKPETQKNISKGKQLLVNLIAGVNSKEKDNISQFEDLTKEQVEALDYWKYMSSRMPYSPNIGTGLLCFIKDLSIEFKSNGEVPSPETVEILEEIRSELQALHDSLFELKFDHDDLHVDFFIREVREASLEIPYYIIETDEGVQVHKGEEDSFKFLVERLQEYIQFNTIPLDEFFADYLEIADETIDRNDFISKTKEYLRIKIRTSQIDGAINFMDPDGGEIINVYLLITELKEYFIGNPYIVKKIRNRPAVVNKQESGDINQTFAVILNGLDDEYKDSTAELRGLVKKVKKNIFDKALAKKDYSTLLKFMSNLESAFQKKDHKIYLLEIFKFMLVFEEENESEDRVTRIRAIQNLFADGGVIEMSISLISKDSDPQLVKQAFELLNKLLEYNNTSIKQKLLNHLRSSGCSFELFTFIKGQLRLTRDFFMEYQRQKESGDVFQMKLSTLKTFLPNYIPQTVSAVPKRSRDTELTIVVLLFLQLCCDNCYQPFQDYMREQTDINTKVSIDLVTELGQFLINMIGLKELKSNEHDMTAACRAVNQCFKTLADMCSGPCTPNQYILGQRRRLYKFINWIIDYPDVDMRKPSAWLEIFSSSVKFLNSLIEANQSKRVAKIFFEEISIDNLIKHATLI